ncbi:hypothetical protein [Bdellovibrio svalbardensis]|uniref:Uncharacterized protein n=1 Tax=Bdellovibrio svalbardensis TaxID=2972972 RepID=A0ABT6DF16_9BACT|nr:hypothetical protein [Bdellovibrio svalbardensis]MDG0815438.1 hypothetical protein [Bdellovibrio svalbardensis]
MSKRSSFVLAAILIFSALAYSIWDRRSTANATAEASPMPAQEPLSTSTSELAEPLAASTPATEVLEQPKPQIAAPVSIKRKASSQAPAEQLPNSPFLTGEPVQTVATNTPPPPPSMTAPIEQAEQNRSDISNELDWVEFEAATRYASQTHSQNFETSKTHLNPLSILLAFSWAVSRSCAVEASWRQGLQETTNSTDRFPMNRLTAGLSYIPQKTFFTASRVKFQGGLERSLEASLNDSDSPPAYREYTTLNLYGGATWIQPLNSLWALDIQLLFRQPLLKPDGFSSYTENGWSVLLQPGYQLDQSTKVGFKLGYESKAKTFEWSAGSGNTRGRSTENDTQVGLFIRFSF